MHPTFWQIYQTFGPTYPGDMHATTNTYVLHYPVRLPTCMLALLRLT